MIIEIILQKVQENEIKKRLPKNLCEFVKVLPYSVVPFAVMQADYKDQSLYYNYDEELVEPEQCQTDRFESDEI